MLNMLDKAIEKKFLREPCRKLCKVLNDSKEILDYIENYKPEKVNVFEMKNIEK
jgi:predicted Rossmann-fold nucleotide-binding protein